MFFNSYLHQDSIIHRASPKLKILFLLVAGTICFFIRDHLSLLVCSSITLALYFISKFSIRLIFKKIKSALTFLVIIFIVKTLSNNWKEAMSVSIRLTNMILLSSLITLTTKTGDLMQMLENFLKRFSFLGINPSKVSLVLALSINFIPVLKNMYKEIYMVQKARNINSNIKCLLLILTIRTIKLAEEISDALEARL